MSFVVGTYEEVVTEASNLAVPALKPVLWFYEQPSLNSVLYNVVERFSSLAVSSIGGGIFNAFTNLVNSIWLWVLYNLISPLLVILFVILFFIGQYYLIKLYIKIFQYIGINVIKLFNLVIKSNFIKKVINELDIN